jgi:hypothetical protein
MDNHLVTNPISLTSGLGKTSKSLKNRHLGLRTPFWVFVSSVPNATNTHFDQWTKDDFDRFKNFFTASRMRRKGF